MRSSCSTRIRDTHAIVMIGEIGGNAEEVAAEYIKKHVKQAGGGIYRGADGASGAAHGPCGRDHQRRAGDGGGKVQGDARSGDSHGAESGGNWAHDGGGARSKSKSKAKPAAKKKPGAAKSKKSAKKKKR